MVIEWGRQRAYNVILRSLSATTFVVGNHCCSGKAINITYSECVFLVLGIQHAKRMSHIFICGVPGTITFFHIIS